MSSFRTLAGIILLISTPITLLWFARFESPATAQTGGTATPTVISVTPTIDRLAAPPTVEHPSQADDGAQLYWLHCLPCHGDRGQGLTDEWRAQYPPEDRNCWESGCHGARPYENGFTLPDTVPPVIGAGSLSRFETLGQVHTFTRSAMPWQMPGHLSEEEYLAITAFLARAHDVGNGSILDNENVHTVRLRPVTATDVAEQPETVSANENENPLATRELSGALLWGVVIGLLLIIAGGIWLWHRYLR